MRFMSCGASPSPMWRWPTREVPHEHAAAPAPAWPLSPPRREGPGAAAWALRLPAARSYCGNVASECASATMTFVPTGTPSAFGFVTTTWMARAVRPLWFAPAQPGTEAEPSQNCSFRVTKPIPGSGMVVLAGGVPPIGGPPITETPTRVVPPSFEDAAPPPALLLACDLTRSAHTVVPSTQTLCA